MHMQITAIIVGITCCEHRRGNYNSL